MKTCEGYEDMISAFIDGVLPDQERLALMEHMAHCSVCQNYFNEQIAIHDALMDDAEAIQAPDGFAGTVMDRVRLTPQERTRKPRAFRWQRWAALAACCMLAAVGVWRTGLGRTGNLNSAGMSLVSKSMAEDAAANDAAYAGGAAPNQDAYPARTVPTTENTALRESGSDTPAAQEALPQAVPVPEPVAPAPLPELNETTGAEKASELPAADVPSVSKEAGEENTAPAPASEPPGDIALPQDDSFEIREAKTSVVYAGILTTSSPLAAAWVEDHLDAVWVIGEYYELNAEEYRALRDILAEGGAVFDEQTGPSGSEGFLLTAADAAETD